MNELGTARQVPDGWELRFERPLRHPVETVWAAITDPAETPAWWGTIDDADWRVGGRVAVTWANEGGPTMHATITAYDPPRLLETEGDVHGRLRWELHPDGEDGTLLVFTSTLPQPPDETHEGMHIGFPEVLAGWHTMFDAMARALDGRPAAWTMDEWHAARDRYASVDAPS